MCNATGGSIGSQFSTGGVWDQVRALARIREGLEGRAGPSRGGAALSGGNALQGCGLRGGGGWRCFGYDEARMRSAGTERWRLRWASKPRSLVPEPRRCGSSHRAEGEYKVSSAIVTSRTCRTRSYLYSVTHTCWKSGAFWAVSRGVPRSAPQSERVPPEADQGLRMGP